MYYAVGKQVLRERKDVAQACDNATALLIVDALNAWNVDDDPIMPELREQGIDTTTNGHVIRREGDEYVCSTCHPMRRWDASEGDDHP